MAHYRDMSHGRGVVELSMSRSVRYIIYMYHYIGSVIYIILSR